MPWDDGTDSKGRSAETLEAFFDLLGPAASTPGRQTDELVAACMGNGTRYRLVPAAGTNITCSRCSHRDRKNRETQAAFR